MHESLKNEKFIHNRKKQFVVFHNTHIHTQKCISSLPFDHHDDFEKKNKTFLCMKHNKTLREGEMCVHLALEIILI
jgi:hypothetical protein